MSRWGLTLPLTGVPLAAHRDLVRELPDLGYTDIWSAETAGTDAFTPLALAAEWAPGLRLGTAIAPIYTRGPGLLAMSAATVAELAPGRFVLGVGTSTPIIATQWNAMPFEAPYARARDTVRFLRAALRGDKVTESYETFAVSKFRLERPPTPPPPIVLAALRPGMLRLAAREADGAITNWLAPSDVPKVRAELGLSGPPASGLTSTEAPARYEPGASARRREDAGFRPVNAERSEAMSSKPELVARIFVCPTADAEAARGLGRLLISSYLTVPVYAAFHDWLGRGDALRPMHEAWAAGDRAGANAAIPDEVVDDLIVHGPVEKCRERVAEYVAQGLDTPAIALLPTGDDPLDMVRRLAPS